MSFIAQDTGRSCMLKQSNQNHTYYLWDNKGNCWCEPNYIGDGNFGGKNFFTLCNEMNIESENDGTNIIYPNITESSQWIWQNSKPEPCPYNGFSDCYQDPDVNIFSPNFSTFVNYLYGTMCNEIECFQLIDIITKQDLVISQPFTHIDKAIDYTFLNISKLPDGINLEQFLEEIMKLTNIQITSNHISDNLVAFCAELLYLLEPNAYEDNDYFDNKKLTRHVISICHEHNISIINGVFQPIHIDLQFLSEFYDHSHEYEEFLVVLRQLEKKYGLSIINIE